MQTSEEYGAGYVVSRIISMPFSQPSGQKRYVKNDISSRYYTYNRSLNREPPVVNLYLKNLPYQTIPLMCTNKHMKPLLKWIPERRVLHAIRNRLGPRRYVRCHAARRAWSAHDKIPYAICRPSFLLCIVHSDVTEPADPAAMPRVRFPIVPAKKFHSNRKFFPSRRFNRVRGGIRIFGIIPGNAGGCHV